MPIQLLPMPETEWHIFMAIITQSFRDTMGKVFFPNGASEAGLQHTLDDMKRYAHRHPDRVEVMKVIDTDLPDTDPLQRVIGVSHWRTFAGGKSEQDEAEEQADHEEFGFPPGGNVDAFEAFYGSAAEYQKKHLGRRPFLFLAALATRPGHGRKGVGAMAVEAGCQKADRSGWPMYLEGSPDGVGLYKKWGFEVVDELPWDAREYGLREALTHRCMKRPARIVV